MQIPQLAKLAKVYLGIPAILKEFFSTAGFITTKQRNCLKAKNVEAIIFLNKNSDYIKL